jgi:hypothetical protein
MENKFNPVPAGPAPPPITNTVFPKGGVPMPATPQQQQAFGLVDAMQASRLKQEQMGKEYGPWSSFAERAANQYSNNMLAIPSVGADLLSAPFRSLRALQQGQPAPAMFGATPRLTVEKIASGARAAEAAARGEDPTAAYNQARANIDIARGAMQQQFPWSQTAGSVAGDIGTLFTGRLPFTRLPGTLEKGALASETMAPGATKTLTRAWEGISGKFGRPLAKAGETGVEAASLAILNEGDPVKTGALAAGGQLGGSTALKFLHSPRAYGYIAGAWLMYSMGQRLIPGGTNSWGHAVQEVLNHSGHALLTGMAAAALGAGRFKGSPHGASEKFADEIPLLADGINLAFRTPATAGIADLFTQDRTSQTPVVGPLLNKMMNDPGKFTTQELETVSKAIQDGALKPTIDRLMSNDSFRAKVGL